MASAMARMVSSVVSNDEYFSFQIEKIVSFLLTSVLITTAVLQRISQSTIRKSSFIIIAYVPPIVLMLLFESVCGTTFTVSAAPPYTTRKNENCVNVVFVIYICVCRHLTVRVGLWLQSISDLISN